MTNLAFIHYYFRSYGHLIFNMLRIDPPPILSYSMTLYTHTHHHQICISLAVIPTLSVWSCFSSLHVKNNHKTSLSYNTHLFLTMGLWVQMQFLLQAAG